MVRDIMRDMPMILQRLAKLGIDLPTVSGAFGAYVPARRSGDTVYVSGQLPLKEGRMIATGSVPSQCSVADATAGARQCVINALAAVRSAGLMPDDLRGVVRVGVFVNSDPDFTDHPAVANGASELLKELFADRGQHARAAVGVASLPMNAAVEVEVVFEAKREDVD